MRMWNLFISNILYMFNVLCLSVYLQFSALLV